MSWHGAVVPWPAGRRHGTPLEAASGTGKPQAARGSSARARARASASRALNSSRLRARSGPTAMASKRKRSRPTSCSPRRGGARGLPEDCRMSTPRIAAGAAPRGPRTSVAPRERATRNQTTQRQLRSPGSPLVLFTMESGCPLGAANWHLRRA
eukprot:13895082-Alexandrium_andersonii.AAC.1